MNKSNGCGKEYFYLFQDNPDGDGEILICGKQGLCPECQSKNQIPQSKNKGSSFIKSLGDLSSEETPLERNDTCLCIKDGKLTSSEGIDSQQKDMGAVGKSSETNLNEEMGEILHSDSTPENRNSADHQTSQQTKESTAIRRNSVGNSFVSSEVADNQTLADKKVGDL